MNKYLTYYRRAGGFAVGVCGLLLVSMPAKSQDVLFQEQFLDVPEGGLPLVTGEPGGWLEVSAGANVGDPVEGGTPIQIVPDADNDFGYGTENQFLRLERAQDFSLLSSWDPGSEVVTFSFDFIARDEYNHDHRWIHFALHGEFGRAHLLSMRTEQDERTIRGLSPEPLYGENQQHLRFDLVANSSWNDIDYDAPDGGTVSLGWGEADVWINNVRVVEGYNYVGSNDPGLFDAGSLNSIEILGDSSAVVSVDVDNVTVIEGAQVGASIHEDDPDVTVLFQDRFDEASEDGRPTLVEEGGLWDEIDGHQVDHPMLVVRDEENRFGYGSENQFLRVVDAQAFALRGLLTEPEEVITYSFDLVHDQPERNERWVHFDILGGDGDSFENPQRTHITSLRLNNEDLEVRPYDHPVPGQRLRLDTILNNSDSAIEYTGPDGSTHTLPSEMASLWADGEIVIMEEYDDDGELVETHEYWNFARQSGNQGLVRAVTIVGDSRTRATVDVDNLTVFSGAHVMADIAPDVQAPTEHFAAWQEDHFTSAELGEPSISGPDADPDGDGLPNLVEYALGLDPRTPDRGSLPAIDIETVEGEDYLTLTFSRPTDREDIEYSVQLAGEVGDWQENAVLVSEEDQGDGTEVVVYRDSEPVGAETRRFMHLEVAFAN